MTPPRSVIIDARRRHQSAVAGMAWGTLKHGGTEYAGAVSLGEETLALDHTGQSRVQPFEALISKARMAPPPAQGDAVEIGGLVFKVVEVRGHNDGDESWHLRGSRTIGRS